MFRKSLLIVFVCLAGALTALGQSVQNDTVLVLPFENASGRPEFAWVGESFASALTGLLKVPSLNVVSNDERKIIQQRLRVPPTVLPSLATSLMLARESRASLLVAGRFNINPAQGDSPASISVLAKIIRVNEGRFLSEEFSDGRKMTLEINLEDALLNLQTIQGQMAYKILYLRDKALPFRLNDFIEQANKVPARAFEAYIKGLLTPDADVASREGYLKNALRIYAEDEKTKGGVYADAAIELGHYYIAAQKLQEALDAFSKIPPEAPQFAEAAFYSGIVHWRKEDYELALAALRPLAEDLKLTSVYNTIGAIAVQASRAEKRDKAKASALLSEGIDYLKKALESSPDARDVRFNYGFALFLGSRFAEAAQELRPVLAISPKDGEAYFLLAKAAEILKEQNAADFDNMARQFLVGGDRYAKMQVEWSRAKTVDTVQLRVVQPPRKDFVSVILIKRQATPVSTPVNETEALLIQARKFYKEGRDDEAMEVLRRVLVSEPMSAETYYLLGMIHLRRTDLDQAVSSLKTALFWDNRLTNAYVALVKIYVERKDCLQAQNYLRSVQEIDGENQEVQGLVRMVERCTNR